MQDSQGDCPAIVTGGVFLPSQEGVVHATVHSLVQRKYFPDEGLTTEPQKGIMRSCCLEGKTPGARNAGNF